MRLCDENEIKKLLSRHGFRFSKSMGQNFLIADWVPRCIAEQSGIGPDFGVLEIGPGIGALTQELVQAAGRVVSVELDKSLFPLLRETVGEYENLEIIGGDILKTDIPALVEEKFSGMRRAVCANLPYNITSPVISALIDTGLFETITVMVQREVARRICAKAGTSDYGAFSVYAQYYTQPEILFDVGPECFMPPPKVHSAVVKMTRREAPAQSEVSDEIFFRVVRAAFAQRRKTLSNSLASALGMGLSKDTITQAIKSCGLDERVRGETLDIAAFSQLARVLTAI